MAKDIKTIPGYVAMEIIESALNSGIIEVKSEQMMKYFEMIAGHKIYTPKPIENLFKKQEQAVVNKRNEESQNQKTNTQSGFIGLGSSKISKPIGAAAKMPAFMDKSLPTLEMYKVATDEATRIRGSKDVLQKKDYGISLASRYKEWLTPELFDYLSMKGPRAEAELRAACYPARVAFTHRVQKKEGKIWATPYITIFTPGSTKDAKDDWALKKGERAYSFYLTNNREVHAICDDVYQCDTIKSPETREKQRAESLKDWQNSNCEKRVRVYNPKTGVEQYALLKSDGIEDWQEKWFLKKEDHYKWPEVYDMTSCFHNGKVDFDEYWGSGQDLVTIEAMGRESIAKIPSIVMNSENLRRYTPPNIYDYDKKGNLVKTKAPKGYEEYQEDCDDFVTYWNQMEMDRAIGYTERIL